MLLTAQRTHDEKPVCEMDPAEKAGLMRVKPTTFNDGININATVLCPTCDCEKVRTRVTSSQHVSAAYTGHYIVYLIP